MRARVGARSGAFLASILLSGLPFGANAASEPPAGTELKKYIEEQDALIRKLQQRVDELEKRSPASSDSRPPEGAAADPRASEEVEEELVERALERALIRKGGLILGPGGFEVEPRLAYRYRGTDALEVVGPTSVARRDIERDTVEASLGFRFGLPWRSQAEIRVPYILDREEAVTAGLDEQTRDASGWGDVEIEFTKQLLDEDVGHPGLLGSLSWKTTTGESNQSASRLAPGSGFDSVQAGFTALKRTDPFVFFGQLTYIAVLSNRMAGNDIDPGDGFGLVGGAILAASPDTSLRFALELNRLDENEVNGERVPGSSRTVALLQLGTAVVLRQRALLDIEAGIGLTNDSPDFTLEVSVPLRIR